MKTEVYTCDSCKESKSKESLARLEVKADGIAIKGVNQYAALKIDICPECLKKKGFVVEHTDDELEESRRQNKVTLEDKIFEILEDMGVAFVE